MPGASGRRGRPSAQREQHDLVLIVARRGRDDEGPLDRERRNACDVTAASTLRAQVIGDRDRVVADGFDGGLELGSRDAEFLGPVTDLVVLAEGDQITIATIANVLIVRHIDSRCRESAHPQARRGERRATRCAWEHTA